MSRFKFFSLIGLIVATFLSLIVIATIYHPFRDIIDCEDRNYKYAIVLNTNAVSDCHYYVNTYEYTRWNWITINDYCKCNKVYNNTIQLKPIEIRVLR